MSKLDRLLWVTNVMSEAGFFDITMPLCYIDELYHNGYEVPFIIDATGYAVVRSENILEVL